MFDDITAPDVPCPKCKKPIKGWQSKDGPCMLETLPFAEVDEFYSSCHECRIGLTFTLKTKKPPDRTITDYEMTVDEF